MYSMAEKLFFYLMYLYFKVYLSPKKKIDMWKGHILEVHCTNIQLKIFIK